MRSLRFALVVLCVLAGLFIVGESYLRLGLDRHPARDEGPTDLTPLAEYDPVLGVRYRPNSDLLLRSSHDEFAVLYQVNEIGLRDRPMESHFRREVKILALGDQQLEGWGANIEDTFIKIAEKRLNARTALEPPVRLVNAGHGGFGAAQCYLYGKALLESLRPAAVVLFYTSEMPHADARFLARAERDGAGLARGLASDGADAAWIWRATEPGPDPAWLARLAEVSALGEFLRAWYAERRARAAVVAGDPVADPLAGIRAAGEALAQAHAPSLQHVDALAEAARAAGLPFLLLHLPLAPQVGALEWEAGRALHGVPPGLQPTDDVRLVQAFCAREALECASAEDALRAAVARHAGTRLYFRHDPTPNVEGDKVLGAWTADVLYDWLAARNLL